MTASLVVVAVLGTAGCSGTQESTTEASTRGTDSSTGGGGADPSAATPGSGGTGLNGATAAPSVAGGTTNAAAQQPVSLKMPSIGFDKSVRALGVNDKGEINPPSGVVQWYNKSVTPGQTGISVIAGHVLYDGPDVFYKLHELQPGDVVTVGYGNGSSKQFKVYAEASVTKTKLQTDQRVWGKSDKPVLALITCDAASRVVDEHHVSNYVVWAEPI
ncbi:class F sortase [Dermacoccaceae bacterium W4C1]